MDTLAEKAGQDPLGFRLNHLAGRKGHCGYLESERNNAGHNTGRQSRYWLALHEIKNTEL